MTDRTEERQAIVIALTAEQTEQIRQATGAVVTELTLHIGSGQAPHADRTYPPGPYATFPPGPSAQPYPPGPSRA